MDLDADGKGDILSGSYSREDDDIGGLFQVLYGKGDGTFRKAKALNGTDGKPLIITVDPASEESGFESICTRPFAVDWDGDGDLDLIAGNYTGTFYWFAGEGNGKFRPKPEAIMAGKDLLQIEGGHSDPFVIDWDGDGDLDVLSGSSQGGVQWAENIAGAGKLPELRPFQVLIKASRSTEEGQPLKEDELTGPTKSTRVWAADVNGDNKLDLLVGHDVTLVIPAEGLSKEQFKKKYAAWRKTLERVAKEMSSRTADDAKRAKAEEDYERIYEERSEFMEEEDTGFVWLYLRK